MKKFYSSLRGAVAAALAVITFAASAQTWDFTSVSSTDQANLAADPTNWTHESSSSNNRYKNATTFTAQPLMANGAELEFTKGLKFTLPDADAVRVDIKGSRMALNKKDATIIIPEAKAGYNVSITILSSSSTAARSITATNLDKTDLTAPNSKSTKQTHTLTVAADGDVTLAASGGIYVYSLSVTDPSGTPVGPGGNTPSADHSVKMNPLANQMLLKTTDGDLKYYNTADLDEVSLDKTEGTVTVTPRQGDWNDIFTRSITDISFTKAPETGSEGDITNGGVNITDAKGWLESAYVIWEPFQGATSYRVYIKGGKYTDFTKIDQPLVRNYGSYGRADMTGLPAGTYSMKVVPVIGGSEDEASASVADNMTVKAYDRSGFAFLNNTTGIGAYKLDGSLKDDARVLYVTAATAKTVSLEVLYSTKEQPGSGTVHTGLQAIITAYQKGIEKRPLVVRIIGTITDSDMDGFDSSSEGIQVKGKNDYSEVPITFEGIGEDAAVWGFGFLIRNSKSVEFRNFAIMLCMDDALSFDTDNSNCWVHHMDFFYGNAGGAADQAKGDGTVDIKGNSQYMTIAYNRFHDSGKTSLCGMKSESGPNYIDYHHNWFDHSDSRHPRVRTMTVHVWNNYYDGVAKYGVGATTSSSVFVERNFFRATNDPMMISKQGTDAKGDGTFSGENGGMIKSFGNVYAEKGASSNYTVITHKASPADFDCYEADSRDEAVPSSYKAKVGGGTYNNFDTDPKLMYDYTPIEAIDVPAAVTGYYGAGRLNKGDFTWDLNYEGAEKDYGVIKALKTALQNYKSSLVGIFE